MDKPLIISAKNTPLRPFAPHLRHDQLHFFSPRLPTAFGHHVPHMPVPHMPVSHHHANIPPSQPQSTQPHMISDEMMEIQGGSVL